MSEAATLGVMVAIGVMAFVTYLCRISGYALMRYVPLTPRVRRGLNVLPGCIIISAIAPIALRGGTTALAALAIAILVMIWRRSELLALVAGLLVVTGLRAFGL
jgi:uncharacterized membrane protein